jgi:hypothetical protein
MKKIFMISFCLACIISFLVGMSTPIASAERRFGRIEGRALRYDLPLYQGTPPSQYTYKSLGHIKFTQNWNFQSAGYNMCAALEGLANKAKAAGANAVIKIEPHPGNRLDFSYDGEAVIFSKLPEKPYK